MKILHAADGSPHAEAAEQLLGRIPFSTDSELVVANVVEQPFPSSFEVRLDEAIRESLYRDQVAHAKEILKSSIDRLSKHFRVTRQELCNGHAADEITKVAESEQVDLV